MSLLYLSAAACSCLVTGTLISTPAGPLPVEQVQPGQKVFSFDHAQRCVTVCVVTRVFRHEDRLYGHLQLADGRRLLATDSHPIYVANRAEYVAAGEIAAGDEVVVLDQSSAVPRSTKVQVLQALVAGSERATVFDLTVEGHHNYFADGILVHNKSPPYIPYVPSALELSRTGTGTGSIDVVISSSFGSYSRQCTDTSCSFNRAQDLAGATGELSVTLTAVPGANSRFEGWDTGGLGSCASQATCSFKVNADSAIVSATFSPCLGGTWCKAAVTPLTTLQNVRDIWEASDHYAWVVAAPEFAASGTLSSPSLWRWNGQTLSPDHQPQIGESPLLSISGSAPADVWAVGERGTVMHWDGSSWSQDSLPTLKTLRAVRAEPQTVWVVGDTGSILQRTGGSWKFVPSGTSADLYGVFSLGDTDAWAVGSKGAIVHFDGTAWTAAASGTTLDLRGVWGRAANDLWAVGQAGTLLHWDGAAWKSVTSGSGADLLGIRAAGPGGAAAYGTGGTILRWDGTNWIADTNLADFGQTVYGVWLSATGDDLAATAGGLFRFLR